MSTVKKTTTRKKKATTATKAKKSNVKSSAKKASEKKATQKVVMNRELKYIYPEDIFGDKAKMKSFRNKVRKTIQKMEASISKLKGQARKDKRAELDKYLTEVHVQA